MCLLWLIRHRITMPRTRTGMRFQPRCTCNQLPFTFNRRQHRSNTTIRRLRRQPPFRRRLHQHRPHQRPPSRDRLCRHHHRPRRRSRHRVLPGQLPGRIAKPIQSKPEANQPSIAEGFFWVMSRLTDVAVSEDARLLHQATIQLFCAGNGTRATATSHSVGLEQPPPLHRQVTRIASGSRWRRASWLRAAEAESFDAPPLHTPIGAGFRRYLTPSIDELKKSFT